MLGDAPHLAFEVGLQVVVVNQEEILASPPKHGFNLLAWLLPMLWLSGGPAAYLGASTQLYGSVLLPTSVLGGSLEITLAQVRYLLESTLVGLGPLGLVALVYLRRRSNRQDGLL